MIHRWLKQLVSHIYVSPGDLKNFCVIFRPKKNANMSIIAHMVIFDFFTSIIDDINVKTRFYR